MIDSITCSFCLRHYVQNGLSYLGEETRPKLSLERCQANSGVRSFGTKKHQLLHRIASVKTPQIYNNVFILELYLTCETNVDEGHDDRNEDGLDREGPKDPFRVQLEFRVIRIYSDWENSEELILKINIFKSKLELK